MCSGVASLSSGFSTTINFDCHLDVMVHACWGMSIGNVAQVSWEMDERERDQAVMIRPKSVLNVVRIWGKFLDVGGEAFGADVFLSLGFWTSGVQLLWTFGDDGIREC